MACCLEVSRPILHLQPRWKISIQLASSLSCGYSMDGVFTTFAYPISPIVQLHVSKDSEGTPVPYIGVDDVARGIAFLSSDESKMINGAMIPIDNAWSTI